MTASTDAQALRPDNTTRWQITSPGDLGRSIIDHDPANRAWPAAGVLFADDAPLLEKAWRRGLPYDQGKTSSCVGQTGKGLLNTAPNSAAIPYYRRHAYDAITDLYAGAQQYDEWPGTDYDGTSSRGLAEYLRATNRLTEYRWAFGVDDVLRTLSHAGPVGLGIYWRTGLDTPDARGLVHYDGPIRGGHEIEAIGIYPDVEEIELINSWGPAWGVGANPDSAYRGRCRLSFPDLDAALTDDGDAITFVTVTDPGPV